MKDLEDTAEPQAGTHILLFPTDYHDSNDISTDYTVPSSSPTLKRTPVGQEDPLRLMEHQSQIQEVQTRWPSPES